MPAWFPENNSASPGDDAQRSLVKINDLLSAGVTATISGTVTTTGDEGPSWTPVQANVTSADQSASAADVTGAPTAGQKIVVDDLIISVDTDMTATLKEETSGTTIVGPIYLVANLPVQITLRNQLRVPTADKKLQYQTSVAGNINIFSSYHSEA